jgi:hypothetical protein
VQLRHPSADQTIFRSVNARTLEQEASLLFHPAAAYAAPGEMVAQLPQSVVNQRWQRGFLGTADRENVLRESVQNRQNNYKDFPVNVPQMSADTAAPAGSTPQIETRVLDQSRARQAGANFAQGAEGLTSCGHDFAGSMEGIPQSGAIMLDCRNQPSGGRANYELFGNFRLKNGWKVVRAEASKIYKTGEGDLRWDSEMPSAGSDNPFVKIHLWANPGGYIGVTYKVTIQGPTGTDPYQ